MSCSRVSPSAELLGMSDSVHAWSDMHTRVTFVNFTGTYCIDRKIANSQCMRSLALSTKHDNAFVATTPKCPTGSNGAAGSLY